MMKNDPKPDPTVHRGADLEIHVTTEVASGVIRLRFILHSATGKVGYTHHTIEGEPIRSRPEDYPTRLLDALDVDVFDEKGAPAPVEKELVKLGRELYHELFPKELQRAYREFRDEIETLLVVSDEPWIPWELVKPYGEGFGDDGEDDFLFRRFAFTRRLAGDTVPSSSPELGAEALAFARAFYGALEHGEPLEHAAREARLVVRREAPGSPSPRVPERRRIRGHGPIQEEPLADDTPPEKPGTDLPGDSGRSAKVRQDFEQLEKAAVEAELERLKKAESEPVVDTLPSSRDVHVTTAAPETVRPGAWFGVEVIFHLESYEVEERSGYRTEAGVTVLTLRTGARLTVRLVPLDPELVEIDQPEAECRWAPPYRRLDFRLRIARDVPTDLCSLRVEFWCEGVQLARTYLDIEVDTAAPAGRRSQSSRIVRRLPRTAFASYSRVDKVRVAERVESLLAVGIDVFLDCLDIRQAETWREVLEREVSGRDALLLFWSTPASRSIWVEREWRHALEERGADHILPNALESPDVCPPPSELEHLQFGSVITELVRSWQRDRE